MMIQNTVEILDFKQLYIARWNYVFMEYNECISKHQKVRYRDFNKILVNYTKFSALIVMVI